MKNTTSKDSKTAPSDLKKNRNEDNIAMSESDRKSSSPNYIELSNSYRQGLKTERTIQNVGSFFSLFTSCIEILVFILLDKMLDRNVPTEIILRNIGIFVILFVISISAMMQLKIIRNWNKTVNQTNKSLTHANYQIISKMRTIQAITVLILILNCLFIYQFNQISIPRNVNRLHTLYRMYLLLRRVAYYTILIYSVFEVYQLIRWTKRIESANQIESIIMDEMPGLKELSELNELNFTEKDL
jgi:hypothetical protein